MTRVHRTHPQPAAQRSAMLDRPRAAVRKKKPYKIVLEAVTQEKRKLRSIVRLLLDLFIAAVLTASSSHTNPMHPRDLDSSRPDIQSLQSGAKSNAASAISMFTSFQFVFMLVFLDDV